MQPRPHVSSLAGSVGARWKRRHTPYVYRGPPNQMQETNRAVCVTAIGLLHGPGTTGVGGVRVSPSRGGGEGRGTTQPSVFVPRVVGQTQQTAKCDWEARAGGQRKAQTFGRRPRLRPILEWYRSATVHRDASTVTSSSPSPSAEAQLQPKRRRTGLLHYVPGRSGL